MARSSSSPEVSETEVPCSPNTTDVSDTLLGNAGLGKETVLQLAKHDPKEIYLAARTPLKAEEAIAQVKKTVPNGKVSFLQLDLSSFDSIKKAANEFKDKNDRLDILINNAVSHPGSAQ